MKTRAEIQKEYRARKKAPVLSHLNTQVKIPQGTDGEPMGVEELTRMVLALDGYRKVQEQRIQALEDGAARAGAGQPLAGAASTGDVTHPERPGPHPLASFPQNPEEVAEELRQRFGPPVPSTVIGFQDPRTLTGQALRDWVRRNGPVPTAFGDMEAS